MRKDRVKVFEEEEVRVRIFILILCQNFRRRVFVLLLMWAIPQIYRHYNYKIKKTL